MKPARAPRLEKRRAADFERELVARARAWIPAWNLDEGEPDFGLAVLKIAARFSSEVAERLDVVGGKMALGFLDWLGLRAEAARPARMPVVFRLAETAREPVRAPRPVKMQVEAGHATVTFETETELRIVPGRLEAMVGVDPASDTYFLPPPGLSSLDPLEPLPTAWRLKNFAAPGSTMVQLDPGIGLAGEMLVEIAGAQYRIVEAKGDLVTIDPAVPAGDGFATATRVAKVEAFRPFDGARNRQQHILYIGDADLLAIDDAAAIRVAGISALPDTAEWRYWGKKDDGTEAGDEARWREFSDVKRDDSGAVRLLKPKGSIEQLPLGNATARWIRALLAQSDAMVVTEGVTLSINPGEAGVGSTQVDYDALLRPEIFVNSMPSPPSDFYPLGRTPRLFDTLYLGSDEAFSKEGATAEVHFDLADAVFRSLSAIDAGPIGFVLAGLDARGALHLLKLDAGGTVTRLANREPMKPDRGKLLSEIPPVLWVKNDNLYVAVATAGQVLVWNEVWPASQSSQWLDYGTPAVATSQHAEIAGLALVDWGGATLVALRDKLLSTRSAEIGDTPWIEDDLGFEVGRLHQVRHETAGSRPTSLLVVTDSQPHAMHFVKASGPPIDLFGVVAAVAPGVRPIAVERNNGALEVVAAEAARRNLAASEADPLDQIGTRLLSPPLSQNREFAESAQISGRIEDGRLSAYAVAAGGAAASPQSLVAWQPFVAARDKVLLEQEKGPGLGELSGLIAVVEAPGNEPLALVVGSNRGEIFAAKLGGTRVSATAPKADLLSALAVPSSAAVAVGDTVARRQGTDLIEAVLTSGGVAGQAGHSNLLFFWLDRLLDQPTGETQLLVFKTLAVPDGQTTVQTTSPPFKLLFANTVTQLPGWILVDDGTGTQNRQLIGIISFNATTHVATVDRQPAAMGSSVDYWLPQGPEIRGRIFPALVFPDFINGVSTASWTVDALDRGALYFPDLSPQRQRVIAYQTDAQKQPWRLALDSRWLAPSLPLPATIRFTVADWITGWVSLFGDAAATPALSWEYWDGSGWSHLPIAAADDSTNHLRNSGSIRFEIPDDLEATEWAGKTSHWIRARLIGGDYGTETVVLISEPGPQPNQVQQTVKRTTEGVQPPYALDVGIAYSVDEPVAPAFLLTGDSGTLRDQSDANRTAGAEIEIFAPLRVTLARFDARSAAAAGDQLCVPDCECPTGKPSVSPAARPATAAPTAAPAADSLAGRRALYLGFKSKLLGEPINLLFLAGSEGAYDRIAPLRVDALIGDRFVPVAAADETRALGETGLLKMAFSVEPIEAELFGRTLAWLRLTPSGGDSDWTPSIAGLYPNAVWSRAAETMTRELVGSSEGQPLLTLAVARPPLVRDSLELRVREPLGAEERDALLAQDPDRVKSGIPDLPGDWVRWIEVPDPVDCGPTERAYALDEATGTIRFGDGRHGAIPPAGVDSIVAFAYQRTEPGVGGEVPANQVAPRTELNLVSPVESVETVFAADRSAGGVAPESPQHVQRFAAARLRHRGRAVAARDFEDLARQRSAEVVQARCFVRNGRMRLVVAMRGANPWPSRAQQRELWRMLLEAGPAALAAPGALTIMGPAIRRLRIALVLRVASLDLAGGVAEQAKARLVAQFDSERGGEGGEGWPIGRSPREDDIAEALLDLADLSGIASVALFEVDELGAARPWPATIGPRDLVMLAPEDVRIGFEPVETVA